MTERTVMLTGIGGQGIQLAARTLAVAAVGDGLEAMVFGEYGGMMRGGNSDGTVVVGTGRITSPPTVSRTWAAIVLHHEYWADVRAKLLPAGVVVVDRSVFQGDVDRDDVTVVDVMATTVAAEMGHFKGASMVALGALSAATGIVTLAALEAAAGAVLPSYRSQHAAANAEALRAGHGLIDSHQIEAWPEAVGAQR